jgi:hypothetical protein
MDFEDFTYSQAIPPGLTKTVARGDSLEALRAYNHYDDWTMPKKQIKPKVEVRVIGFDTQDSD